MVQDIYIRCYYCYIVYDSRSLNFSDASTCPVKVVYGDWMWIPEVVRKWATDLIVMCQPDGLHVMDGSESEDKMVCFRTFCTKHP